VAGLLFSIVVLGEIPGEGASSEYDWGTDVRCAPGDETNVMLSFERYKENDENEFSMRKGKHGIEEEGTRAVRVDSEAHGRLRSDEARLANTLRWWKRWVDSETIHQQK